MLSTLIKATKNHLKMSFSSFVLLPNIIGKFGIIWSAALSILVQEGALYADTFRPGQLPGGTINYGIPYLGFDANKSSSVYGNASTVQPSSLIFNYIIKY